MKNFKFKIEGKDYNIALEETDSNIVKLNVNGKDYNVELDKEVQKPTTVKRKPVVKAAAAPQPPAKTGGVKSVKAPLPGSILEIKVKTGAQVKPGDVVLIMEAMKMENNVIAEHEGEVTAINVNLGQAVMQDDILVEIQ
jgi:glutaconyl-CoA/methylmalonyl-CoA decarboxylase subunit gamma